MINIQSLTIQQASKLIATKQIKALELNTAFLDRTINLNPKLNAFITISKDDALFQSKKVDSLIANNQKLSLLAGIPIAFKDLFSTKGIKTTAGSKVLENYTPVYNSTVTKKLLNENISIIGKTNLDAWGHGSSGENSDFGPSINPYDFKYVPGGSSSGSAVAVAAGMCLGATGTDTGGSIRLPASFCNLVSLKPTYGRVSRSGVIAMSSSLDSVGHITKTVYDNALILNVTAGHDFYDSTTKAEKVPDYTKEISKGVKGLRIGLPREYFNDLDKDIKKLVIFAVNKLEDLGAIISEVSLPHTKYSVATYYIIQPSEVSSNLARYDGVRFGANREKFGDEAKRRIILGTYTLSSGYYDEYYLKAMKVRRLIKEDYDKAFNKIDTIICPTSPTLPFKLGEKANDPLSMYLSDIFLTSQNLAGIPSLNIPCGFINDLPVGMQIMGPQFSEQLLYQVGFAYEQTSKFQERRPNI